MSNCGCYLSVVPEGELNVLDDILTEAPDQDDELYNPESEHHVNQKKGTFFNSALPSGHLKCFVSLIVNLYHHAQIIVTLCHPFLQCTLNKNIYI